MSDESDMLDGWIPPAPTPIQAVRNACDESLRASQARRNQPVRVMPAWLFAILCMALIAALIAGMYLFGYLLTRP